MKSNNARLLQILEDVMRKYKPSLKKSNQQNIPVNNYANIPSLGNLSPSHSDEHEYNELEASVGYSCLCLSVQDDVLFSWCLRMQCMM